MGRNVGLFRWLDRLRRWYGARAGQHRLRFFIAIPLNQDIQRPGAHGLPLGEAFVLENPVVYQRDGVTGVNRTQRAMTALEILQPGGPGQGEVVGL